MLSKGWQHSMLCKGIASSFAPAQMSGILLAARISKGNLAFPEPDTGCHSASMHFDNQPITHHFNGGSHKQCCKCGPISQCTAAYYTLRSVGKCFTPCVWSFAVSYLRSKPVAASLSSLVESISSCCLAVLAPSTRSRLSIVLRRVQHPVANKQSQLQLQLTKDESAVAKGVTRRYETSGSSPHTGGTALCSVLQHTQLHTQAAL